MPTHLYSRKSQPVGMQAMHDYCFHVVFILETRCPPSTGGFIRTRQDSLFSRGVALLLQDKKDPLFIMVATARYDYHPGQIWRAMRRYQDLILSTPTISVPHLYHTRTPAHTTITSTTTPRPHPPACSFITDPREPCSTQLVEVLWLWQN